jgi:hypothetical protein
MPKARPKKKTGRPRDKRAKRDRAANCVSRHFAEGLIARGEAVPEPPAGTELPPGVTHTFEPESAKNGSAPKPGRLRRRRFSLV